jgi:MFS family permease
MGETAYDVCLLQLLDPLVVQWRTQDLRLAKPPAVLPQAHLAAVLVAAAAHIALADLMLLLAPSENCTDCCHQPPSVAQASCNFGFDSPTSQSLLTSSVFAGMLLGAASWGFLADELGRRKALLASTAVVVGAGLASSIAPTPAVSASTLDL